MSDARPIGVFDSGVGGLTVVRALSEKLPHENIVYFGDTARVPYGPKSPQVVREYALDDTNILLNHDVKLIVVACNTVSAVALDVVQKQARVPVVGVIEPGALAAVKRSKSKRIGIIGTVGTIKSNAYGTALKRLDADVEHFSHPCPLFVPLAEEGWMDHRATELIAKEYLFPLTQHKIDTLILGCTHYPILKDVISRVTHQTLQLIDSGEATAEVVAQLLDSEGIRNLSTMNARLQFFVSDVPHKFAEIGERFLGRTLGRIQRVSFASSHD
ncbi:MAG: glutamate racemase [Ignavibacteria bacterium]|nr:glutamate racemase [Ignavibacteria bacterium]